MPSLGVGHERHAVALLGARDDHRRPVGRPSPACTRRRSRRRRGRRSRSRATRTPRARSRNTSASHPCMVGPRCPSRLRSRIAVRPPSLVERRRLHGLPDRPSAISESPDHHPDVSGRAVEPHRERHPHTDREPLAERARRDVDPRQLRHGRRVSLDRRAEPAQREQLLIRDGADRLQRRVQDRGRVTLREHESVVRRIVGVGDVRPQMVGVQDRDEVRRRHR